MLQQGGQIPLGMFDTDSHQNVPGSFAAGQSHCIVHVRVQDVIICIQLFLERNYVEAL